MVHLRHVCAALGLAALIPATSVFADSGIFSSLVIMDSNGGGNTYYALSGSTNTAFNGLNLGTFNPYIGNTLVLNGAQINTFKNNGDNITHADLFYSITPPPSGFTDIDVFFDMNLPVPPGNPGDQEWQTSGQNVNVLAGLSNGTYDLAVYADADFTFDNSGGSGSGTYFVNLNGVPGENFVANFTVVPEPASLSVLGLGAAGLLLRRRRHHA